MIHKHGSPGFKSPGPGIGNAARCIPIKSQACDFSDPWRVKPITVAIGLLIIATLSACTSQPIVGPPVYIPTKTYIPIPATLTQPISVDLTGDTWGKAVGDLKAGLATCNGNLGAIQALKPPTPRPL